MPDSDQASRRFRFFSRRLLVVSTAILLAFWLGSSAYMTWKLTRRPHPPFQDSLPAVAWGKLEEHRIATADGQEIGAWLLRGEAKRPCVLLLHGNGGSRQQMLSVLNLAAERHCSVMAINLRAHGDSTGEMNDIGWSARHDVVAAVAFLERECPGRPIFIVGRSLGAAAAVFAGNELNDRVAGYFLEQPYKDLSVAVWHRLRHVLPPALDYAAYAGLRIWSPWFLHTDPAEISLEKHVVEIPKETPIVFITGSADRHAPLDDVVAVYDRVRAHAKLIVVDGAFHESLDSKNPKLYRDSLFELLRL